MVPLERVLGHYFGRESVAGGIERVVPNELIKRAVEIIASGLGRHVDLRGLASKLRGIDSGLHLKLLQGVDRRLNDVRIEVRIGVINAVQCEIVEVAAVPRYGNILVGAVAPLARAGLTGAPEAVAHVGRQRDQLQIVAPVQRQLHNPFVLDDRADRSVFGGQQLGRRRYLDRFVHLTDREIKIEAGALLHLQLDVGANSGLEPVFSALKL